MLKNWLTGENKLCTKYILCIGPLPTHFININLKHLLDAFPLFDFENGKNTPLHCDTPPAAACSDM